jgi:hypothetical protein
MKSTPTTNVAPIEQTLRAVSSTEPEATRRRGNYTAQRCKPKVRARIVNLLAQGQYISRIAEELSVANNTVMAIRDQECNEIQARKQLIASQAARAATVAFDQLNHRLDTEIIPTSMLVPIAGMSVDKLALLSNDPQQINVTHTHTHQVNIHERIDALSKRLWPASVIDAQPAALTDGLVSRTGDNSVCVGKEKGDAPTA